MQIGNCKKCQLWRRTELDFQWRWNWSQVGYKDILRSLLLLLISPGPSAAAVTVYPACFFLNQVQMTTSHAFIFFQHFLVVREELIVQS